ncbi:MAG: MmgE/PrpD family protein [Eubacteriales bacterium]|nr:MmgE/PrpD family protein [Eubacteriales bacterium]
MKITDRFLGSIEEVAAREIPQAVLERAKRALMDYIAVTIAGAKANQEKLTKYLEFAEPESGSSTLIGMSMKTNLKEAAFLNGLNAHALDFDDGTNTGIIHLGSPIFSVLIPLAEKHKISVETMLKAAVIGYETSFTMAVSIQPKHKAMGYHATGTCGVLGIATAVSYMLDYTIEERRNAFAIAAVSATGMLKVLDDESELKPYNVAKSALLGLTATQLAKAGFVGHHDVLGGDRGYLKMMTGTEDIALKEPLLGGTYAIEKAYTKPYAACRYCHPAIEAAIKLRQKTDINRITGITVSTYDLAVRGHDHTDIQGIGSAKMSIPYGVAVGLLEGKAGLLEYDENHTGNADVRRIAKAVRVFSDERFSASFPQKQSAIVSISLADGSEVHEQVDFPKGEPENPMNNDEFNERAIGLLEYAGYSAETGARLVNTVLEADVGIAQLCDAIGGIN